MCGTLKRKATKASGAEPKLKTISGLFLINKKIKLNEAKIKYNILPIAPIKRLPLPKSMYLKL